MRMTCRAPSHLSRARALFASAAILTGAATSAAVFPAKAQDGLAQGSWAQGRGAQGSESKAEDTALAIPRLPSRGPDGVALPRPSPSAEAWSLRAAFEDPDAPVEALRDSPLLGHVLASRILSPRTRAGTEEMRDWLERYPALPDAPAVHALLLSRLPKGEAAPPPPALAAFPAMPFGDDIEVTGRLMPRNPALDRRVQQAAWSGDLRGAIRLVAHTPGLSPEYGALLRAEVARAMFSQGRNADALRIADGAHQQARGDVGLAPWIGGLAAWRLGRPEQAQALFADAYRAPLIAPGQRAGAAYWAARAALVTGGDHGLWMHRAASDPRTFYGLLARRVLGQAIPTDDSPRDTLGEADVEAVGATARGGRAFGLLQAGQPARAAAELKLLWAETRDKPGFGRSVLVVARAAGLSDLAEQLGAAMQPTSVRLPARRLRPAGGFKVDPALVYAMTRLESNFDAQASSPAGAQGLMQLMPDTARYITAGGALPRLHDPATNLDLGQRYLLHLEQLEAVGPDLIRVLASYNAGPGTVSRWLDTVRHEDDPLLFIEALPNDETRAYVPRVLAYSWLYAAQLGLPSPTLDELAVGLWPQLQTPSAQEMPAIRLH